VSSGAWPGGLAVPRKLSDLVTNERTGRISHTKVWSNVAYAVATAVVLLQAIADTLDPDMLLIYLAIVGAAEVASKFISLRYSGGKGVSDGALAAPEGPAL
jgi:hypothetical protein